MIKQLEQLTPDTPATLQYTPDFQDKPITIRGDHTVLETVSSDLEALEAQLLAQNDKVSASVGKTAVTAPEVPTMHYEPLTVRDKVRQYFADAHVRKFDREMGTDLYSELQLKRKREAVLLKASELHLFDTGSQYYKSQLKRLAKAKQA